MSKTAVTTPGSSRLFMPAGRLAIRALGSVLALVLAATLFAACSQKKSAGELEKGLAAYKKKDYKTAVELFRTSAEKGNSDAMLMMSCCLEKGFGTEADKEESEKWMKKAADAGNPFAQAGYGMNLIKAGAREEAFQYLRKSVDQDCIFGMLAMGIACIEGKEWAEGVEFLKKVASLPPSNRTGIMDYTMDDEDLADFGGREISAENMFIAMAQFMLGAAYLKDDGPAVKQDFNEARKWLAKAAESGMVNAKEALEILKKLEASEDSGAESAKAADGEAELKEGLAAFEKKDFKNAAKLFRTGAKKGNVGAMIMLGVSPVLRNGSAEDEAEADEWTRKSGEYDEPEALFLTGLALLRRGEESQGVERLERSAGKGCVLAQFALASFYVKKNDDGKAWEWFGKTARNPLAKGKTVLDFLGFEEIVDSFPIEIEPDAPNLMNHCIIRAQIMLGVGYLSGKIGLEENTDLGMKWLEKAAGNCGCTMEELNRKIEDMTTAIREKN